MMRFTYQKKSRRLIVISSRRRAEDSPRAIEGGNGLIRVSCLAVFAVFLSLVVLTGCGGGASSSSSGAAAGTENTVVEDLRAGPLDFKVFVDDSASRASTPLIEQSMVDVKNAFELTLASGGSFSAVAIRGDLGSAALVATAHVPSAGGGGNETERSEVATKTRSELQAAEEALLKKGPIAGLRGGSALTYDLRQALASVDPASGGHTVILLVTDGVDDTVKGHLGESTKQLAARLSSHLGSKAKRNRSVTVIIAGVGESAKGAPGGAANRLKAAWKEACEKTGAQCSVSTEVEAPVLLEAFEDA
jgi:hypothetical protein